ncbi:zinc finger protein 236-like isoform X2 [Lineus longissimus]|uniref:zinc finger protein 236-like isoform X2 n=1 Tax=Lineus longissimus TaxID=88925 RepID=UPI00315DDBAF
MMRDEAMPESHEENTAGTAENMQAELHKKGAVLTKAWADLFSYLTKYQAELTVKENTMEIAEKEIEIRKKQFEDMKPVSPDCEEFAKLQDEIHGKERLLTKTQSELTAKDQLLQRTNSDLTCNMEMLQQARNEVLDKQNDLIRYRGDIVRLKSQLAVQQEQVSIKDNLLKKLQTQLMKENDELKEQSELDRRALELERRAHEMTKRSLREIEKSGRSSANPVIEIPDSPPTLDLSVEHADFGLSNIISMTETPTAPSSSMDHSSLRFSQSSVQDSALSHLSSSMPDFSSRLSGMAASSQSREASWRTTQPQISPSQSKFGAVSHSQSRASLLAHDSSAMTSSASDTFFPLSVDATAEDSKGAIDTSAMNMITESDMGPVPISGPIPSTPGTSDSSQGPVPMSGMSPGGSIEGGGDGKGHQSPTQVSSAPQSVGPSSSIEVFKCTYCPKKFRYSTSLKSHLVRHTNDGYRCEHCGKGFYLKKDLERHVLVHTGERPFCCSICGKRYQRNFQLKMHMYREHVIGNAGGHC